MNHTQDVKIAEQIKALFQAKQSKFFTEDRVEKWVDAVLRVDPERLPWHIKRTYGFGGSEVGVLVAERNGISDPFDSARNICAGKLLMANPSDPIPAMERGQYMEDVIAKVFMDKNKEFGAIRDEEAMRVMSTAIGMREWQNGSPDDVVLMGKGANRKRFIIDYKAPGESGYELKGVPMRYAAQVHHYGMIAEKCNIDVDGYLIVAIDYKAWHLEMNKVPYDPSLVEKILESGDYYWNEFILQDRLPDYGRKQQFDKTELSELEEIESLAMSFLVNKRLADMGYQESKKAQAKLASMLSKTRIGDSKLPLVGGLLEISAKPKFDVDTAVEALGEAVDEARKPDWAVEELVDAAVSAGVDVAPFARISDKFDEERLREMVREHELNLDAFEVEGLTFSMTRAKKGPVAERMQKVSDEAKDLMTKMSFDLERTIEEDGLDKAGTNQKKSKTVSMEF